MKKDVAVAVAVGFVIGAVVALTATNLPQIIQGIKIPTVKQTPSPTPQVTTIIQSPEFTIDLPKDESVVDAKTIEFSGRAKAGQLVVVETADDHIVLETELDTFSGKLTLAEGVNTIYFTVYDENGNNNTKTINVYYTTEKL